jgi:hypothetical protein
VHSLRIVVTLSRELNQVELISLLIFNGMFSNLSVIYALDHLPTSECRIGRPNGNGGLERLERSG